MKTLCLLSAVCCLLPLSVSGQTKAVLKNISGNTLTEALVVPSGGNLTINSGGSITNNGTATGFGGASDGDKGDITVSGSGSTWTIDNSTITAAKISDAELAALASVTSAADVLAYFTGSGTASSTTLTSFARTLLDDTTAVAMRTTLGLGGMATQASNAVSISGGTIVGVTFNALTSFGITDTSGMIIIGNDSGATDAVLSLTAANGNAANLTFEGDEVGPNYVLAGPSGYLLTTDGNGSALTALNATQLTSGTVGTARLGSGTANSTKYLRGDSTWQTLDKSAVGLGNVENTALSSWGGAATISTVGTITAGTWNSALVQPGYGGTGGEYSAATGFLYFNGDNTSQVIAGVGSGPVVLQDAPNLTGMVTIGGVAVPTISSTHALTNKTISGASNTITNLSATNLSSGTVPTARLGSGTADSTTYLRGDSTWQTISGGSPGGAATQVQFNNAGAFDGDANLLWDDANARFQVGSSTGAFQARQAAAWLYNTSASETNYERGGVRWASNTLGIGTEKGGTGATRSIALIVDGSSVFTSDGSTNLIYRSTNCGVDLNYTLGTVSNRFIQVASGGVISGTVTKTANYTATTTDNVILCDATSGNITITLPAAASHKGRKYVIKKIDSSGNTVTIDGNASETIDDATTVVISTQYAGKVIQSDNAEWWIIGSF